VDGAGSLAPPQEIAIIPGPDGDGASGTVREPDGPPKRPGRRLFALGASGWAMAAVVWIVGWQIGVFRLSGDVALIFLPAGRAFWSGGNPYDPSLAPVGTPFLYAPPWAALFGILSPLDAPIVHALLSLFALLALRYMARSWLMAGVFCWFILVPWEIAAGHTSLLVAAAIVGAVRGRPEGAAIMGLAKGAPVLAVHPRDWRPLILALAVFSALSLPRLDLWPAWIEQMVAALNFPPGPLVPVPLAVRLPIGIALVLLGRPWSRALGAALAIPGLYWSALVVFVAPVAVILETRRQPRSGDASTARR
jgi:hypothetical protein